MARVGRRSGGVQITDKEAGDCANKPPDAPMPFYHLCATLMPPTPQSYSKSFFPDIRIVAVLVAVSTLLIIAGLVWLWSDLAGQAVAGRIAGYAVTCTIVT